MGDYTVGVNTLGLHFGLLQPRAADLGSGHALTGGLHSADLHFGDLHSEGLHFGGLEAWATAFGVMHSPVL